MTNSENAQVPSKGQSYIQEVPDHCDRIIWRKRYYHLENMTADALRANLMDAWSAWEAAIQTTECGIRNGQYRYCDGHWRDKSNRGSHETCEGREIERLRGLKPELPPRPPDGGGLPRYGLRWNGPHEPVAVPMDDGFWTPWHLAAKAHGNETLTVVGTDPANRISQDRFDAIKQSPRQADVTDVEDLCDEIERLKETVQRYVGAPLR